MAEVCCGVVSESESPATVVEQTSKKASRRRRMEMRPFKLISDATENGQKRQKLDLVVPASPRDCDNEIVNLDSDINEVKKDNEINGTVEFKTENENENENPLEEEKTESQRYGLTSVCGRRRDMEDAVSVRPSLCKLKFEAQISSDVHFYGVFDGHGCSHVAMKCRDRFHEIVKEEIEACGGENTVDWKRTMERSFAKMDKEVTESATNANAKENSNCRCELQTPQCDAVGSTAVVAVVTPDKIIVANCGDSRAVLCRNGVALPLSDDHKPDRPDELIRIEEAGGRVIYWDGARVLGVLAMSRAIGDNYLKPYVIPEPEVTITERNGDEECLILASDGLWDVVTNETACGVVRMCLRAQKPASPPMSPASDAAVRRGGVSESSDKGCSDATILLTKLALARHSSDNISVVVVDLKNNQHL